MPLAVNPVTPAVAVAVQVKVAPAASEVKVATTVLAPLQIL